uniref:tape measure protein n=1 Tax=Trichocoleus desertorum TaxID=1481672 RepID=UPI0025B4D010|nr:tape measure protein [Trichocoleus desertorum]
MPEEIGSLSISLHLEKEQFNNDLQALETLQSPELAIAPKLNTDGIGRQLQGLQGEVAVGLRLEKGQFEQQLRELGSQSGLSITVGVRLDDSGVLDQASALKGQLEQQFGRVKLHLKPTVDDSALTKLNQHLDLKQRHFAQVRRDFRNPVKPAIDTSELDAASAQFDALKQKIADLQNQAASVRFTADTSEVDAQINRLQGKSIRLKSTVEGGESSATESADIFAKAIAKALKKSNSKGIFGGLFEGIGSIVSAPFKVIGGTISNVFTGVGLGIGEQISKDLGQGLFAGIEDELSPLIGSFELVGRKAGQALTKELLDALGGDAAGIQRVLSELLGQDDVLVQSGVKQSRRKKTNNSDRVEATRFFQEEDQQLAPKERVKLVRQQSKLFDIEPALLNDQEKELKIKVGQQVQKLDQARIKKLDNTKIAKQVELVTKQIETEQQNLSAIQNRLKQQEAAIADAEKLVEALKVSDPKSPKLALAKENLKQQRAGLFDAQQQQQASQNTTSRLTNQREELKGQDKPLAVQIEAAAERVKAENSKLKPIRGTLDLRQKEVSEAQKNLSTLRQVDPKSPEFSQDKIDKAREDLAQKQARLALAQKAAAAISSNVLQYSSKLDQLVKTLDSFEETANQVFQPQFEQLEIARDSLRDRQRRFTKKNQILTAPDALGRIQAPETLDAAIADSRSKISAKTEERSKVRADLVQGQDQIATARTLARQERENGEKFTAESKKGLKVSTLTPERVKAAVKPSAVSPVVDEKKIRRLNEIAITLEEDTQVVRFAKYRQLNREIAKEEALVQSLLAQKSTTAAKSFSAGKLRQEITKAIGEEKRLDAVLEKQIALGNEAEVKRLEGLKQQYKGKIDALRSQLALLGDAGSASPAATSAPPAAPSATQAKPSQSQSAKQSSTAEPLPVAYVQAIQKSALAITGQSIPAEKIPSLKETTKNGLGAGYVPEKNAIALQPNYLKVLSEKVTRDSLGELEEAIGLITHELTHAFQFDFGKNDPQDTGFNPLEGLNPTPQEVKTFGSRVEQSVASGEFKNRDVIRGLESQAYVAQGRFGPQIAKDVIKQKAIAQVQDAGGFGGVKLKDSLTGLYGNLKEVIAEAKAAGIDVTAERDAILQKASAAREQIVPLIQKSANLEILPVEEILDLQEEFEKSVGTLVPIAGDIQRLRDRIAGKATQAGIAQPGAVGPTSGQSAATNFKSTLGLGAGKLRGGLEQAEFAIAGTLQEITEVAAALGVESAQEIQDAIANINKAKADLEPLFDKAAQVDILPVEEIAALQEQIQAKTQAAIDIIESQPDIVTQQLEAKAGSGGLATQEAPEPAADREELQGLLRQFGVKKLRPLAQEFGINTEGLKKGQIINRLTSEVDPQVLQPKVFELTRAKAQQQVARQEQLGAIAQGTGSVAKKLLEAGQNIAGVLAPFTGAAGNAVKALGAVAKGGYKLAEASESLVLDIIPFGRTAKGIGQQFVLPAATFAAASHLPGGHLIAEGLTNVATGAISPFAHGAAGGAIDAASGFINHAVPNVFGLQSHLTGAVSGGISSLADTATGVLGQAGAAVLGGKTITAIAGRGANAAGSAVVNALAPGEDKKALPPAEPAPLAIPEAQPLNIPLPELTAEAKGELVPVTKVEAPIAKTKTANEVVRQAGEQAGKAFKATADKGQAIADKAKQTAQAVASTGQQVFNVVRQINPDEALEQAKNIASSFNGTYKELKDALTAQKKALRKGDFSAARDLGKKAQGLAKTVLDLADKAQQDIAGLTSSLGDAAAFGTDLGGKLANKKAQISRVRNEVSRVQRIGKLDDTAGVVDVSSTSSPAEDDGLAAFGDLQKQIEERIQKLRELAQSTLKDESFLTDQAVNIGGLVGGKIGSQFGPVGEAGGDIIGALATRQAITVGKATNTAFNTIKDTDEFKQAGKFQQLILLTRQLKKELQSPEIQKALGGELTGDIAGFVIGNIASKLGGAGLQALGGAVPGAQMLSMVPQGAIAASIAVPKIVQARERFASNAQAVPGDGLAAFGDINLEIQKRYQQIAKLLNGGAPSSSTADIQAKLQELDREIDQYVGDRIDTLGTEVALDDNSPATPELEAPELTDRRRRKQQALSPEQQQKFAALEIEAERDLNEDLTPDALVNAAKFDAAAERISNRTNNTFEQGAKQDPLASKPATAGDRLKATAGKELGEYGKALQQGIGQFGVDLSKLPGFAQGIFAKLAEGPKALNDAFKGLLGNVGNLAKAFAAFQGIQFAASLLSNLGQQALSASIRLDNLRTALNYSSGGEDAGGQSLAFVNRQADEFGVPLEPSIEGFTKLSASTKGTAIEGKATEDIFTGVSSAATVLGLTADQTSGVFLAFSQAMSKGKLSMEELQQIGERVPGTFSLVARSLGVSEAQLSKMLQTGQVLSEDALPKIGKEFIKTFGGSAKTASDNAQSSIYKLQNSITRLQQSAGDIIKPAASVGAKALAGVFDLLAKNSDKVVAVLGIAAAVTIPAILAGLAVLGPALVGLATTTFPFLAASATAAFAALGPVTLAIAAVGAVAVAVAEPGARALANALNGTTQAAIEAVDALAALDGRYNKLLTRKGGASQEEVAGISKEIRDQAAKGEYLPGATIQKNQQVAEQLIAQLERVAAASRAAAEAKRQLLLSIKNSAEAFANESSQLDIQDVNQQRVIQEGVNRGDLTEGQARQLNIDGQKTILTERAELQDNRLSDLNTQLQGLQKDPSSSPEYLEQVTKIQEEIKTGELQLAQTRLQLAQSVAEGKKNSEQDILKSFQDANAQAEAAIRRSETDRIAGIRGKQLKGILTTDQAEAQIATTKEDSATKDYEETKRQLNELNQLKVEGGLPAEEIAKRELELNQKLSDANLRRIEAQIAARDQEKRRIIENLDLANRKAESAIALSQTTQTTAIKRQVFSGDATSEQAAIGQTEVQQEATRKRIALLKQELADTERLRADGTYNPKEATEKELQLKQKLAEANGQLVDGEIQKQEQLRAAIERTFQRQQEQLKLASKQTANQIDRDALVTLKAGPVDAKGLDLQTQSLKLKNDGNGIAQNLTLSQQELAAIDALGQKDQAAADKRKALALQIADLQGQLIANEKEQFLNAREQEIRAIEERAAAQKRASEEAIAGVQQQKDANDLLLSSLDAQSKLLESRNGLSQALNEVDLARLGGESKASDRSLGLRQKLNDKKLDPTVRKEAERQLRSEGFNPNTTELKILERKQALEDEIAAKKLAALGAEQEFQRRALELDLQRQKIAAQNLLFEAEISKLRSEANQAEARSNLEIAQKSGDTTKIAEAQAKLNLADREVGLSDRKLTNAQTSLGLQDEFASNALQTQGAKQQTERINFNSEQESRESERGLNLAEAIGKTPRSGRKTFAPRSASRGGRSVPNLPEIRASEGIDPSIGRTAPQFPTSRPVETPSNKAPSPSNKVTELNDSLRLAVSALTAMRPQIDKIAQELSKPRVENLYVSTPTPVSDAGSILSDIAYQGAVGAGLA